MIRFIDFTAPVHDAQGQVRAVLGAHAHWDWAEDVIQVLRPAQAAQQGLDIFIVNRRGQIIYPDGDGLSAASAWTRSRTGSTAFSGRWRGARAWPCALRDPTRPSAPLRGDALRLEQILINLVGN